TVYGLARVWARSWIAFGAMCLGSIALECWYLYRIAFGDFNVYNQAAGTPLADYHSWIPGPVLYDADRAYSTPLNYFAIAAFLVVCAVLVRSLQPRGRERPPVQRATPLDRS